MGLSGFAVSPHTGAHANVMCKKVHSITTFGVVPNTKLAICRYRKDTASSTLVAIN